MSKASKIRDLMSKNVLVIQQDYQFSEVCRLFFNMNVHHLPVVDGDGKLKGILSTHDVLKAISFNNDILRDLTDKSVAKIAPINEMMSKDPITISPDKTLGEAAAIFLDNHIQALPVVEDGMLIGIITTKDVLDNYVRED